MAEHMVGPASFCYGCQMMDDHVWSGLRNSEGIRGIYEVRIVLDDCWADDDHRALALSGNFISADNSRGRSPFAWVGDGDEQASDGQ